MNSLITKISNINLTDDHQDDEEEKSVTMILEHAPVPPKPKTCAGQTLTCTKPCQFAARKEDGKRGCCFKTECSFAHGWDELRYIECKFPSCYRKATCPFKHPDETGIAYYKRTKKPVPDLPETSEETRKVRGRTSPYEPEQKMQYGTPEFQKILDATHQDTINMTNEVAGKMDG